MDVDWALITAVATVLGVVGGLVSVVFVVYGILRNAQAIEGSTVQSLMSLEQQVFLVIMNNAETYRRGCQMDPAMTDTENFSFAQCVAMIMSMTYSAHVQHQQNLMNDEVWTAYENAARARLATPGFLAAWQGIRTSYPVSFQAAMEAISPASAPA